MQSNEPEKQKPTPIRRNRHSNSFRDRIIRHLHYEKGFSWPKAERGFRAVFDVIAQALRSGDVVELPGIGIVKSVRCKEPVQRRWKPLYNVHTRKSRYRVVPDQRRPRRIYFRPYRHLDFTPPPPPPQPPPPQEIEARQLAAELLGTDAVADNVMNYLQQYGVDVHPHYPGALLKRLRELKKRGKQFQDVMIMAGEVAQLYWL
jgi:nucleoid DNA-binding protein